MVYGVAASPALAQRRARTFGSLVLFVMWGLPLGCGESTAPGSHGSAGAMSSGAGAGGAGAGGAGQGGHGPNLIDIGPPTCGNAAPDPNEMCEDGNYRDGDGCSSACQIEMGATCPAIGACAFGVCGDGILDLKEECDDGNLTNADGCSPVCLIESHWVCPAPGRPCRPRCGDGMLTQPEQCDDGNRRNGDGCSSACLLEPHCDAATPGTSGEGGAAGAGAGQPECSPVCGDGIVTPPEECDDGPGANLGEYGGCTPDCHYAPYCGDEFIQAAEECDNGINEDDYGFAGGCSPGCRHSRYCGDGHVDADQGESCDTWPSDATCRHCQFFSGP